jgi:chromosome segregation ATPase
MHRRGGVVMSEFDDAVMNTNRAFDSMKREIAELKAERDKLAEERDEYKRAEAEKYKFYQYELDRANKVQTKADRYERVLRELERDLLADELTFLNAPDRRVSTETLLDTTQLRHDWLRAKLPELFGSEKGGE